MVSEARIACRLILQPTGEKPLPAPYPQVSFASKKELRDQVASAVRLWWPRAAEVSVEVRGPWRDCRGVVLVRTASSTAFVEVNFAPVIARPHGAGVQDQLVEVKR